MVSSRLVTLLKTFSKQEMKDFEKFITSPYFSTQRNLKPMYNILRKFHPSFESPHLTNEKVFRKLNPGKKYDKKKSNHYLQVLISELTSLAEKFLAMEELQKEKEGYLLLNSALSNALKKKNLINYRYKLILKIIGAIKSNLVIARHYDMVELNINLQEILYNMKKHREGFECAERIPLYMYGSLLGTFGKLINDYKTQARIYDFTPRNIRLLEMGIQSFDPEIYEKECYDDGLRTKQNILFLYYIIKSQLNNDDEESLMRAIEIYKTDFMKLGRFEKWMFFKGIFNICAERRNHVDFRKYSSLGCDIIDFTLGNGIFGWYENKPEPAMTYIPLLHFKISLLNGGELKQFIDMMIEKVQKDDQKWSYEYSYAWLSFKNNDYEKTLENLSKISIKTPEMVTNINKLKILSLYSLGHNEETIYNLDSFDHFIRSNTKISGVKNDTDALFINTIRSLLKVRTSSSAADEYALDKIAEENKNSNFHLWFKAEAEKLKKKKHPA